MQENFEYVFCRMEMKYLLTEDQYRVLRELMSEHMVEDQWGPSTVMNVYYDTPSFLLARRSLEHPLYKEKIRTRRYGCEGEFSEIFLELKKKCDGIVYKRRISLSPEEANAMLEGHGRARNQIEHEIDFTIRRYGGLTAAAFIAYDREAYYAKDSHDFRMTFDRRVRYRSDHMTLDAGDAGTQILPDGQVLLEVKTSQAIPMWLVHFLSAEKIYKTNFSKYGMVFFELQDQLKFGTA